MARGRKRHFLNGNSQETFAESASVPANGVYKSVSIDEAGFSDEIADKMKHSLGITTVGQLLQYSSYDLRHSWSLKEYVIETLDTFDEYLYESLEKQKKEYYDNPEPIYRLLGLKDPGRYANYLIYDFNEAVLHFIPEVFGSLRKNGIITLLDFFKLDLVAYHELFECSDNEARLVLVCVKKGLRSISKVPAMVMQLDSAGKDVITYPLPEDARGKVSSLTDDRIAGDRVSLKGMTSYEKALYGKSCEAIEDCGEGFYYDVIDSKEIFESFSKSLAVFYSQELELLQRKEMIRSLYFAVPDRIRKMPARVLCRYMRPRYTDTGSEWPYRNYYNAREVVFFKSYEPIRTSDRMMTLEAAFGHMEDLMNGCSTIEELDKLINADNDKQFMDLLDWLSHANMLNAIYDTFMKPPRQHSHEAPKQMKQEITETDPDEVIARFAGIMNDSPDDSLDGFPYYQDDDWNYSAWSIYRYCRYDFFSVYMLLTGKTSVPAGILDDFLYTEDAEDFKRYLTYESRNDSCCYEYNPETGMVSIKANVFE
ncbi:MAG: hypothetical protein LUE27_02730 [Clostridia bacterium]|nr:hypothetical protein [Clostridia bacterium]